MDWTVNLMFFRMTLYSPTKKKVVALVTLSLVFAYLMCIVMLYCISYLFPWAISFEGWPLKALVLLVFILLINGWRDK